MYIILNDYQPGSSSANEYEAYMHGPAECPAILIVDDQESVRALVAAMLQGPYKILAAQDGVDALSIARSHSGEIAILVSDVEMPRMDGVELARQLMIERPQIRVLLNSGNTQHADWTLLPFIAKPFSPAQLRTRIAELLELPAPALECAQWTPAAGHRPVSRMY